MDISDLATPDISDLATPSHPIASEAGQSFWTNLKRAAGTAGIGALSAAGSQAPNPLIAPEVQAPVTQPQAREGLYNATGATEFQPKSWPWKVGAGALNAGAVNALSPFGAVTMPQAIAGGAGSAGAEAAFPNAPSWLTGPLGFLAGAKGASSVGNIGARAITGASASPSSAIPAEDAQLAEKALNAAEPIPLGAAQVSNSPAAKYLWSLSSKMPFSGAGKLQDAQQEAFNRNLAQTMGTDAPRITQDVLAATRERLGQGFNDITSRNVLNVDDPLLDHLQNIQTNARLSLADNAFAPVKGNIENVLNTVRQGNSMPGEAYQSLTNHQSPLSMLQRGGGAESRFAGQIRDALDDAFQRSMSDPADMQKFQQLRQQWRAMVAIEPLTLRSDAPGGVTPSVGDISPAALRGRVNQLYPSSGHAPNDLDTLARVGQRFLKEPSSSGTAERMSLNELLHGGGMAALGFGGAEGAGASWPVALGGAAATLGGNRMLNAGLRNQWLANQMVKGSLNPGRFRFQAPLSLGGAPGAMPFSLAPLNDRDAVQPPPWPPQ